MKHEKLGRIRTTTLADIPAWGIPFDEDFHVPAEDATEFAKLKTKAEKARWLFDRLPVQRDLEGLVLLWADKGYIDSAQFKEMLNEAKARKASYLRDEASALEAVIAPVSIGVGRRSRKAKAETEASE